MNRSLPFSNSNLLFWGIILLSFCIRLFFIGRYDLFAEEAYYWNYATHLDWGYLDHPPMVAVLIKCSTLLFGVNELGVRLPALLGWGVSQGTLANVRDYYYQVARMSM